MARSDGQHVVDACHPQGDEERHGCFWTVGRGTERVEAEDGNALGRAYFFCAIFPGCKRASQQCVKNRHRSRFIIIGLL